MRISKKQKPKQNAPAVIAQPAPAVVEQPAIALAEQFSQFLSSSFETADLSPLITIPSRPQLKPAQPKTTLIMESLSLSSAVDDDEKLTERSLVNFEKLNPSYTPMHTLLSILGETKVEKSEEIVKQKRVTPAL